MAFVGSCRNGQIRLNGRGTCQSFWCEAGSDPKGPETTSLERRTAVITGASSGIGAATAERLSRDGFSLVLGARRVDRLEDVAARCTGSCRVRALDVRDMESIDSFVAEIESADVLVNNAGLARSLDPISDITDEDIVEMWQTNVLGVFRMTRSMLPLITASEAGHIVNVNSSSGFEVYPGGAGYTSSKHALRAFTRTLRLELLGSPVRVTEVCPGLVETEFSLVRFGGDESRAAKPYQGISPLTSDDVADAIAWAVSRPAHVDIDEIVMRPVAQASSMNVVRKE